MPVKLVGGVYKVWYGYGESNLSLNRGNERRGRETFIGTRALGAGWENRTPTYCLGSSRPATKRIPHQAPATGILPLNHTRFSAPKPKRRPARRFYHSRQSPTTNATKDEWRVPCSSSPMLDSRLSQ